jgi:nitrite reductase/ring-hydroxylating ferredoxin subunit
MWSRVWQLACMESDIPSVGDYYEYEIGDQSVLVVRESEDRVRAYHNVCQHRGRRLRSGQGNSAMLRCPYHGWTWGLDGRLDSVPEREEFCPFSDDESSLRECKVDRWGPMIFINLDPDAGSLDDFLDLIRDQVAPYRLDRQYKWFSKSTIVRANWKNTLDAFQEAYHARQIHPETVSFVNYVDDEVELLGDHSVLKVPFGMADPFLSYQPPFEETLEAMEWTFKAFGEDTSLVGVLRQMEPPAGQTLRDMALPLVKAGMAQQGIDVSGLTDAQLTDDWEYFIFPNIEVHCFAFGSWMFRVRPHGTDPEAAYFDMWYLHRVPDNMPLPPPVAHEFVPEGESCGAVMDQDFRNLPIQQLGMHSQGFEGMRISTHETRIAHMHDVLDRYLGL